ncbi:TetR/AcrR family transcriptional regulator [Frankia sp. AgB1.9]|nr:TetR/AcrR family transcriptional regulator [Frankia sp. AgW1.1]MBL7553839.1 TetR/AcrR family transcriptional regulator [Frankia sp. AgB1.9]
MRADARRNREKVLRAAADAFASEGLSVPVQEIARRAGVGTGTVSRHFPTKEALFAAVLLDRMARLVGRAAVLAETEDAGSAFFAFFVELIRAGAAHRGLAEALAGAGYDIEAAAETAGVDVSARLRDLLNRAQETGAVRPDVAYADVKALTAVALMRTGGPDALDAVIAVLTDGLRARPA